MQLNISPRQFIQKYRSVVLFSCFVALVARTSSHLANIFRSFFSSCFSSRKTCSSPKQFGSIVHISSAHNRAKNQRKMRVQLDVERWSIRLSPSKESVYGLFRKKIHFTFFCVGCTCKCSHTQRVLLRIALECHAGCTLNVRSVWTVRKISQIFVHTLWDA